MGPEKVQEAFYRLSDPVQQIEAYVFDVIRSEVPRATLDDLFVLKEELANRVRMALKENMEAFGFEIIATPITDIDPDREVKAAMNEINRQERLKQAAKEQAEASKIIMVKDAEARAQKITIEARAEADAKELNGQGQTRQVMDLILLTQYFDTLTAIGTAKNCKTLFIPSESQDAKGLGAQFRQGILEGNSA